MRIFAYMRYSSENQTGGVSIDMQRTAINAYITTNPDYRKRELIEKIDEAKSATTLKGRTSLAAIRNEARSGDIVIVFKLDRLGRNLYDSLKVLRDFDENGVRVISTSEPDMPVVRNILLVMGEEFSRQLSDRCKRALDGIAKNGFVANGAPYGYKIEKVGDRKKLAVVPEQAAVIKRIFDMRAKGTSHRDIAKALNKDHIQSPRKGLWAIGCIANMLRNETYRGTIISGYRKFKKGHGLVGKRPREEWSICHNAHEAIISEKTWDAVRLKDSPAATAHVKTRASGSRNLLAGFLKCSECGANLVLNQVRGQRYFGCQGGRDSGLNLPCKHRYLIRAEVAINAVIRVVLEQVYSAQWVSDVVALFREEVVRARGTVGDVLPALEKELRLKETRIESATRLLVHLDVEQQPVYLDEVGKLKADRDSLREQIGKAKVEGGKLSLDALEAQLRERVAALALGVRAKDVNEARGFLASVIERVVVSPSKEAVLYGSGGFFADVGRALVSPQGFEPWSSG